MKIKNTLFLSALLTAVLLTGCTGGEANSSQTESSSSASSSQEESNAQRPNPSGEYETASQLAELGFDIVLPAAAENIRYSVIDGTVAEADFTVDGEDYTLRTGSGSENLSGLYGERTSVESFTATDHSGADTPVTVEQVATGENGMLNASWTIGDAEYSFTGEMQEDSTAFSELCRTLIGYLG